MLALQTSKIDNTDEAYMPVYIEIIDRSETYKHISLAHYGEQNGDMMRDPEMLFALHKETRQFIPYYYRNDYMGVEQYSVKWTDEGILLNRRTAGLQRGEGVGFGRAGGSSATVPTRSSAQKNHHISGKGALPPYIFCRGRRNHRARNESMLAARTITFQTLNEPGHGVGDIISIDDPELAGIYEETGWSLTMAAGQMMQHTAKRTVIA